MNEVDRIELIDNTGRIFVRHYQKPMSVQIEEQENGKTIKIFIGEQ